MAQTLTEQLESLMQEELEHLEKIEQLNKKLENLKLDAEPNHYFIEGEEKNIGREKKWLEKTRESIRLIKERIANKKVSGWKIKDKVYEIRFDVDDRVTFYKDKDYIESPVLKEMQLFYVNEGQQIYPFNDEYYSIMAPCSGYCILNPPCGTDALLEQIEKLKRRLRESDSYIIAEIVTDHEYLLPKFPLQYKISKDVFNGINYLQWLVVCGKNTEYFPLSNCECKFHIIKGEPYLQVIIPSPVEKFVKGDSFQICFSGKSVYSYVLPSNPYNIERTNTVVVWDKNNKPKKVIFVCYDIPITKDLMNLLVKKKLSAVRFISTKNPSHIYQSNNDYFADTILSALLFIKYADTFNKAFSEAGFKWKRESLVTKKKNTACYVYLMVDTSNSLHKIGISNKPDYREKTLQSEKPTIEKVCAKQYPSRTIAEAIESALHSAFAAKRVRGEWFDLNEQEIADIKSTLS